MTQHERVRVVLVDDHDMFRTGVRASLDTRIEVVGEAADVGSAIEAVRRERPASCCWTSTSRAATAAAAPRWRAGAPIWRPRCASSRCR